MSVTELERPNTQVVDRPQPRVHTRPVSRPASRITPRTLPQVQVNVRVLERRRIVPAPGLAWTLRAATFVGVFALTYIGSSLGGQVMVERARRDEISAKERMLDAQRAESTLRAEVDNLTSGSSISAWASARGFIAPDAAAEAAEKALKAKEKRTGYVASLD